MLVLRCTTKAFQKLGCKPRAAAVLHTDDNLGEWYVNTIDYLNSGDLMLACMHTESLFILMVPLQPDMDQADFGHVFRAHLFARLMELETPSEAAGEIVAAYGPSTVLAKNTDRQVAGHLNAALAELDRLLDFPDLNLTKGDRLYVARVEHRLNETPRDCSSKQAIWPLRAFWQCLIRLCPELPPRTTLPPTMLKYLLPAKKKEVLRKHLPAHLVDKFLATLDDADVLYTADELRTLASACTPGEDLAASLPEFVAEMHRLASFCLKRLIDEGQA